MKRLDVALSERFPEMSRSVWQKYIKSGFITVNGLVIKSTKYILKPEDDLKLNIPSTKSHDDKTLPIIYLDDNVIVVNKPSGVLTHSKGVLNDEFTVADFFRRYTTYNLNTTRPGIVHRLDRDTSGVIIGARNPEVATKLVKQFANRKTKKTYYAVIKGTFKEHQANIDLPIERNPSKPSTFRVRANGKSAQTYYETIATEGYFSLIKMQPTTGRTHQLRVHAQYIGIPIYGDRVYGQAEDRLYLHAYSLEITIPDGERRVFTAPLPEEFKKLFPEVKI